MQVRLGTKEDAIKVKPLLKDSWFMHADKEPEFINRKVIEDSNVEKYFEHCFDQSNKSFLFVADDNGVIAGVCKVNIEELENFFNEKFVLYVDDIYIKPEYRRQHIAQTLLQCIEEKAREMGICWIKARVYTFNEGAQKTFASFEYKPLYSEYFKRL